MWLRETAERTYDEIKKELGARGVALVMRDLAEGELSNWQIAWKWGLSVHQVVSARSSFVELYRLVQIALRESLQTQPETPLHLVYPVDASGEASPPPLSKRIQSTGS